MRIGEIVPSVLADLLLAGGKRAHSASDVPGDPTQLALDPGALDGAHGNIPDGLRGDAEPARDVGIGAPRVLARADERCDKVRIHWDGLIAGCFSTQRPMSFALSIEKVNSHLQMPDNSPGFNERLGYLRWLRNRGRAEPESDAEVAAALGVEGAWLSKWKKAAAFSRDRTMALKIESALDGTGVSSRWLLDGDGDVPEPEMWAIWDAYRVRPKKVATREFLASGAVGGSAQTGKPARAQTDKRRRGSG